MARLKNFYLKAIVDGRKTQLSSSSNSGMGVSIFIKENGESKEVVYINCVDRGPELTISIFTIANDNNSKTIELAYKKDSK